MRHNYVTRLAAILCLLCLCASAQQLDLKTLLKGVETRYNKAKTLEVQFNEAYTGAGGPRQSESGKLTLRKPGRMRWDYSAPAGKLFVSDGKQVYLYNPELKRVERMPLKESEDMRAPLAFLLGKLDFAKEFRDIQMKPEGPDYRVSAGAKSDRLPYERIEMVVTPGFAIRRLIVNGQDQSILTFEFAEEKLNPPVDDSRFHFQAPAGATIVSGDGNSQ
jgi:outer membrane lipoprotein carrier protein